MQHPLAIVRPQDPPEVWWEAHMHHRRGNGLPLDDIERIPYVHGVTTRIARADKFLAQQVQRVVSRVARLGYLTNLT